MKLYFGNSFGAKREIADCETMQEVNLAIDKFIKDANNKKGGKNPFVRYYTRTWQNDDGDWVFDVGSHVEFFYWRNPDFSYERMKEYDEDVE